MGTIIEATDSNATYLLDYDADACIAEAGWAKDEGNAWLMPDADARWWAAWAERQERIEAAIAASDGAFEADQNAVANPNDREEWQREVCGMLGLEF